MSAVQNVGAFFNTLLVGLSAVQICTVIVYTVSATSYCTEIVKFFSVIVSLASFLLAALSSCIVTGAVILYNHCFVIRVGTQFAFSNKAVFPCSVSTALVKELLGHSVH